MILFSAVMLNTQCPPPVQSMKLKHILSMLTFILSLIKFLTPQGRQLTEKQWCAHLQCPKIIICTSNSLRLHPGQFAYNTTKVHQCQTEVFIPMQHLCLLCSDAEVGAPEIYRALSKVWGVGGGAGKELNR